MDIPHWISTVMAKRSINDSLPLSKLKKRLLEAGKLDPSDLTPRSENFKDLLYFDVAFNVAYNEMIYCLILLTSIISPIVSLFGALYFGLKYAIDKYLMVEIYPKYHGGAGEIAHSIQTLTQFNIFLVEFIMYNYFTYTLNA